MRNILIVLMLSLSLLSCQGKETKEDNVTTSALEVQEKQDQQQPKPLLDFIAIDSIKAVLKQEYTKMREKENMNWIYDRGLSKYRDVIYLDSISFKGKEAFYQKVKIDIENTLAYQKDYENERAKVDNEEPRYSYTYGGYDYFDTFQYIFSIVEVHLKTKNFVFPTAEVYKQRMKEVFGFSGQVKNSFPLMEENGQLFCFSLNAGRPNYPYEPDEIEFYGSDYLVLPYYFYNYSGYNFIYTSLKNWEGIPSTMFNEMEMRDTKNWTAKIRESIYHENNYLFNKSAISLNWLYLHDQEFLTMLYETFGYYGDDRLTRFYIEDVKTSYERFLKYGIRAYFKYQPVGIATDSPTLLANPNFFFGTYRPYDNKFLINKKLLEQFVSLTNGTEDYIYPFIIQDFINNLESSKYYDRYFEDNLIDNHKVKELKMFLVSHLSYYSQKIYDKNPDIAALSPGLSHYSALYSQLYLEESRAVLLEYLKKNNYFGYRDYPAMIEEIRAEQGMW